MAHPRGIRPSHRVVLIKVPRSAPEGGDPATLSEAASKWWVVAESRRDGGAASPEYALAVVRGRVAAAYAIEAWLPAPSGVRWGFTGRPTNCPLSTGGWTSPATSPLGRPIRSDT